jgi:hypothetical protein
MPQAYNKERCYPWEFLLEQACSLVHEFMTNLILNLGNEADDNLVINMWFNLQD